MRHYDAGTAFVMPAFTDMDISLLESLASRQHKKRAGHIMDTLLRMYPYRKLLRRGSRLRCIDACLLSKLEKQKSIERTDIRRRAYRLGLRGRIHALCHILNVSFPSLCILVEAYVLYKQQSSMGLDTFYPIHDIMGLLDRIYSHKTIRNSSSILCRRGFATKTCPNTIVLTTLGIQNLQPHDLVLDEIHGWISAIPVTLGRMTVERPEYVGRIVRH